MRSSKSRSRSKNNRNRSVGNIVNRVFDSSGPEGKVRGTPQQIIDKYNQLARDAQLANDRVAAENFQQHAEHYTRLLGEALREAEAQREQRESHGGQQQPRERFREEPRFVGGDDNRFASGTPRAPWDLDGTAAQAYEEQMAEVAAASGQEFGGAGGFSGPEEFEPVETFSAPEPYAAPEPFAAPEPYIAPEPAAYGGQSSFSEVMDVVEPGDEDSGLVETPEAAAAESKPAAPKKPRRTRKPQAKEGAPAGPEGDGSGGNREAAE